MATKPKIQFTPHDKEINRAYEKRRDTDKLKMPSISIYDVDFAIMYWLREKINFQVNENGRMIDVPIIYANSETWAQVQSYGYMRDVKGKLLTPFATIRRTSMREDERFKKLDVNHPPHSSNVKIYPNYRNLENRRNLHSVTQNTQPSVEYYIQVMPEFYKIEYELLLWTTLIEQMNVLIEDLIPTSNFAWGDTYKFRTLVGDINIETINSIDDQRLVRSTINLTVDARLLNEFELRKSTVEKAFTLKRLVITNERSSFDIIPIDLSDKIPTHRKNR